MSKSTDVKLGPIPDINCMFIGDALYLGDPSIDTTKQAAYTKVSFKRLKFVSQKIIRYF